MELDFALPALAIHHAQRRSDDFELPVPDPCAEGFVPGSRPLWPWTSSQNIVCNANTWFTMESNVLKSIYENIMENKYSNLWDTVIYVLY